jgi:hypothetical protein
LQKLTVELPKNKFKPAHALDYYKAFTVNVPATSTVDVFELKNTVDNVIYVIPAVLVEPGSSLLYRFYKNGALIGFLKNDIAIQYLYERQKFADYMREYPWLFNKGDVFKITCQNTSAGLLTVAGHVLGFSYVEQETTGGENEEDGE